MRETVADRILTYLARNPGAYAKDIGAGVGVSRHHASNTLRVMERDGRVFFCPTKGTGSRYSARFYAAGHDGRAKALANKAQAYSSPFGVLMAQLME